MRAIGDHYAMNDRHHTQQMRDTVCSWWEKLIFFSCGSGYHALHHVYMGVPYYNLKKVHKIVYQNPEYRELVHTSFGIRGLFQDCTGHQSHQVKKSVG
jgi:fatty acid desaturase